MTSLKDLINSNEIPNILGNIINNVISSIESLAEKFSSFENIFDFNNKKKVSKTDRYLIIYAQNTIRILDFNKIELLKLKLDSGLEVYSSYFSIKDKFDELKGTVIYVELFSQINRKIVSFSLLDKNYKIYTFPRLESLKTQFEDFLHQSKFQVKLDDGLLEKASKLLSIQSKADVTLVNKQENLIVGVRIINLNEGKYSFTIKWNLYTKNIINYCFPHIQKSSSQFHASNGNIYHKYLNSNLLLLITQNTEDSILVEFLSENGKNLNKILIEKVDLAGKIIPVFIENKAYISYIKRDKSSFRQELISIELMRKRVDELFSNFINSYFKNSLMQTKTEEPKFLLQSFVISNTIKNLFFSTSNLNVANKYLIVIYENNLTFFMDLRTVSARRPLTKEMKDEGVYVDVELPPYNAVILPDHKMLLSHSYLEEDVRDIKVFNTEYESTFVLCSFGTPVNCFQTSPDKTFDSLPDNFNFQLIIIFFFGIFVRFLILVNCVLSEKPC